MAFIGRGNVPAFNTNNNADNTQRETNNNNDNDVNRGRIYTNSLFHPYYYIPLDNTYVIFEMIATIIIAIVAGVAFIITYKTPFEDPIGGVKRGFIDANLVVALILLGLIILANFFSKDKKILIKRLAIILVIALLLILSIGIGKIYLDKTYTRNKFEQFYSQSNWNEEGRIDFGSAGFSIKSAKDYYIDESIKAYNVFTIKTYAIITMDLLLIVLILFQMYKLLKRQERKSKLEKDDVIVYDEEENVKF